jgi:hypothetical protein
LTFMPPHSAGSFSHLQQKPMRCSVVITYYTTTAIKSQAANMLITLAIESLVRLSKDVNDSPILPG